MSQQIEFNYNTETVTITDNGTQEEITMKRSGNDITSLEKDKQKLLRELLNRQKDYEI